ncbi:MAG: hypothetical protein FWD63_01900 [Propionibacteriaceae bacterium]|nr:hypothetical protein [Propionibacteriaceae bacterium]
MQVAVFNGTPVIAMDMSSNEFKAVKAASRGNPECLQFRDGSRAVPRSGASVGAHFAHMPGHIGETEPETSHHIFAKRVVGDVAQKRGWTAEIEARHPDGLWQADVLVTGHGMQIAFEVQWTPQTLDEYQRRTVRYRRSGIETVWLARYAARTWVDIETGVQALPFRQDAISDGTSGFPLDRTIDRCLEYMETRVDIPDQASVIGKAHCYKPKCGAVFYFHPRGVRWGDKVPWSDEELCVLGERWCAPLRTTYSHTVGASYPMWLCPACGAKQGDYYLHPETTRVLVDGRLVRDTRGLSLWQVLRGDSARVSTGTGAVGDVGRGPGLSTSDVVRILTGGYRGF